MVDTVLQAKYRFYPMSGCVSKLTASLVYKASKEGRIDVLPEFIHHLYDAVEREAHSSKGVALQRYNSAFNYYDTLNNLTLAILAKNYREAQRFVDSVQDYLIKRASKKSPFFKYQKGIDSLIEEIADMLDDEGWEQRTLMDYTAYYVYDDYAVSADIDDGVFIKEDGEKVWEGSIEEFLDGAEIDGSSIRINGRRVI